jgi:UrcA family protein
MLKSFGIAALLLTAASSNAQGSGSAATVRVSYADLDLSGPAGQAALASRLRHASETVCPGQESSQLAEMTAARRCARQASQDAAGRAAIAIARARGIAGIQLAAR